LDRPIVSHGLAIFVHHVAFTISATSTATATTTAVALALVAFLGAVGRFCGQVSCRRTVQIEVRKVHFCKLPGGRSGGFRYGLDRSAESRGRRGAGCGAVHVIVCYVVDIGGNIIALRIVTTASATAATASVGATFAFRRSCG